MIEIKKIHILSLANILKAKNHNGDFKGDEGFFAEKRILSI